MCIRTSLTTHTHRGSRAAVPSAGLHLAISTEARHPAIGSARGPRGWQSKTVPIALHGDGTPVAGIGKSWTRMMDIYSWSSCLVKGCTLDITFLIYAVFIQLLSKASMDVVWKLLCWSFGVLASGVWPHEDAHGCKYSEFAPYSLDAARAGTPLAKGFRAVLFVIRGDLDYFANCLKLNHHTSNRPCSWCPAFSMDGDPMHWAEFRPDVSHV